MVDVMKYNEEKIEQLKEKIRNSNGNYRLLCFDVDDVVFNVAGLMQEILSKIDERATEDYRDRNSAKGKYTTSKDIEYINTMSFKILDAILEETKCTIEIEKGFRLIKEYLDFTKPIIDYEELYLDKNLYENAIDFIKNMIKTKGNNDFFIFISHRNPEREGIIKTRRLYELVPEIDAVLTLPFHKEAGSKENNSKSRYIAKVLFELEEPILFGLEELIDGNSLSEYKAKLEDYKRQLMLILTNCILIDNSRTNCIEWRRNGGIDIRFLPYGYNEEHTLFDHMCKLAYISTDEYKSVNYDPYWMSFVLNLIRYCRENPEYGEELDKIKRK